MVEYQKVQVQALADQDSKLRMLWTEHGVLEKRLEDLNAYRSLTTAEQFERKNLQKLKLARKDEIAHILSNYP